MILAWVWAFNPCAPSIICKKYYFILKQIYINLKILLQKTYQLKKNTFYQYIFKAWIFCQKVGWLTLFLFL